MEKLKESIIRGKISVSEIKEINSFFSNWLVTGRRNISAKSLIAEGLPIENVSITGE